MGKRKSASSSRSRSGAPKRTTKKKAKSPPPPPDSYDHPDSVLPLRPDVGTQPQFKKKKGPQRYRYDDSLSPALDWDGQNHARQEGEAALAAILDNVAKVRAAASDDERHVAATAIQEAAEKLRALGRPFLNWAGKAERLSFDVPTLPLFVHERLSTKAIIETLTGHLRDKQQTMWDLFADPAHPVADQVLRAYEYQDRWVNRMILGDSLVVMNSLLQYEGLGGQVQMIYIDPPYGVKFGSNFQPFVRKRDVKHNDDESLTREPEMVQAYRDTWELGLHSYLSYMRDRLLLARDLLTPSGSVFVQISDENLHHLRELMEEVFGASNFVVTISLKKKSATTTTDPVNDYLIWFAKDRSQLRIQPTFLRRRTPEDDPKFNTLISPDWEMKRAKDLGEGEADLLLGSGWKWARVNYPLVSQDENERSKDYIFNGRRFKCGRNRHWTYDPDEGMNRLAHAQRLFDGGGRSLGGVVFWDDWPFVYVSNLWNDIHGEPDPIYVVQTNYKAIQRCLWMTTNPGDLVFDPTCGSGTTAYVAEQWGRRWITCDVSRVPLALARQRLLTATFDWHELKDDTRGPAGGFVYKRKRNRKGEEVGGIVPHVTLKSIANDEPPQEKVLVDRPETLKNITRVTGPFTFEATIPTPVDFDNDGEEDSGVTSDNTGSFSDRMLEVLRRSPVLRLEGNRTVQLASIRPPAKTLSLSAEAIVVNGTDMPVALAFGPENGAVSEKFVYNAAREATAKNYTHLFVIGFAFQANARKFIAECEAVVGVPATAVEATPDLLMGDLLKNMRSSQIFSVCGLPEIALRKVKGYKPKPGERPGDRYEVELLGLDVFDPVEMQSDHRAGNDVPAWFLDTDYNDLCFHVSQAFFPRTSAWDNLKKAVKGDYDSGVWDHLSGTVSAPFAVGEHGQIAVKVIDDRGNELVVVKQLSEAKK